MEHLYELSRSTLLMDLRQPPGPQLAVLIERIFDVKAVALFDMNLGRQDRVGEWGAGEDDLAKECVLRNSSFDDLQSHTSQRVLRSGTGPGPVGALIVRGEVSPLVVDALASLAAIAMDRHQSSGNEGKAERARQGEELRTAVLDALAHELKTPLAAIQTASSGLLELDGMTNTQTELIKLIDDETTRLNALCTRMLLTSKLDGEHIGLDVNDVNIQELILEVLASHSLPLEDGRIQVYVSDPGLTVKVDRGLLAMILAQFVDNAIKYSTPNTRIKITAQESYSQVLISVHNIGPTIRIEDRERIFDRFYRASDQKNTIVGTGIGLSVARKAAELIMGTYG
jgi:two-component system sensor histidine kinase KdpD